MHKFWQRTPDGRPVFADSDPSRHLAFPSTGATSISPDLAAFEPFVVAATGALPELPRNRESVIGLELFLLGAARRFRISRSYERQDLSGEIAELLGRHGMAVAETLDLITLLPSLEREPFAREVLDEGATALEDWLHSHDQNVALRVRELLADWDRRLARLTAPWRPEDPH